MPLFFISDNFAATCTTAAFSCDSTIRSIITSIPSIEPTSESTIGSTIFTIGCTGRSAA